jgi:hypothetical protein
MISAQITIDRAREIQRDAVQRQADELKAKNQELIDFAHKNISPDAVFEVFERLLLEEAAVNLSPRYGVCIQVGSVQDNLFVGVQVGARHHMIRAGTSLYLTGERKYLVVNNYLDYMCNRAGRDNFEFEKNRVYIVMNK